MFEVGKMYEFRMLESDGGQITFWGEVETYEHPLLKLADHALDIDLVPAFTSPDGEVTGDRSAAVRQHHFIPGKIINVTSPAFVSATRHNQDD